MVDKEVGATIPWDVFDTLTNESNPVRLSSRAIALKGCRGTRGCEFVKCVQTALGHVPRSLQKTCPELFPEIKSSHIPLRTKL